ncbi:MAG TPA: hypothetical protein VGB79_08850 [Allosphingosinicella sp.]|jgi:hypothetical protein
MIKLPCLALATLCAASCATPAPTLPTYRYAGIELSGAIEGTLLRTGNCIRVQSADETFVPVWPRGTIVSASGMQLPAANGGALIPFGRHAAMRGGLNPGDGGIRNYDIIGRCGGRGFLVNSSRAL